MSLKLKFINKMLVIIRFKIPIENFLFYLNTYLPVSAFIISPAFPFVSKPPMLYAGHPKLS